jgi:hypothetical protein
VRSDRPAAERFRDLLCSWRIPGLTPHRSPAPLSSRRRHSPPLQVRSGSGNDSTWRRSFGRGSPRKSTYGSIATVGHRSSQQAACGQTRPLDDPYPGAPSLGIIVDIPRAGSVGADRATTAFKMFVPPDDAPRFCLAAQEEFVTRAPREQLQSRPGQPPRPLARAWAAHDGSVAWGRRRSVRVDEGDDAVVSVDADPFAGRDSLGR